MRLSSTDGRSGVTTAVQAAGLRGLNEGQRVQFDIEADKRGPKAANLKLV